MEILYDSEMVPNIIPGKENDFILPEIQEPSISIEIPNSPTDESKKKIHDKYSVDNMLRKIQIHYLNFIIGFLNEILKNLNYEQRFLKLNYEYKKNVNKDFVERLKKSTLKDIVIIKISRKYKNYDNNINKKHSEDIETPFCPINSSNDNIKGNDENQEQKEAPKEPEKQEEQLKPEEKKEEPPKESPGKTEMCQLIYYDFTVNQEVDEYLRRVSFEDVGVNYNTIAIIGPQSSGKSTLLNKLFDTKFEVMDSSVRRGQTTKGVWIAADYKSKVFIIDCEGTDSKSRSEEDRGKFEHSSSLFSLAMSDILIINMWTSDVGRYTASNYGVLKIVFEMNLKLFEQKTAKKIIIFLRDFDPNRNRKDKIESLILEDIHKIWKEIKLPEKFEGKGPENFFSFEFITLPHLIYCKDDFDKEIENLRQRLDKTNEKYFFANLSSIKNVPADGLKQYVNQIWKEILSDKDLDIPSQREMLANYRCTEIKNKILLSYDKEIKDLIKQSSEKNVENLKDICIDINNRMCSEYEKQASNYVEKVYKNIYAQLKEQISQKLYICFLNQTKRLIPVIQKFMREELQKKLSNIDDNNDDYITIATNLKNKYLTQLLTKLETKKAFESWKCSEKEFSNLFDEIIKTKRKRP